MADGRHFEKNIEKSRYLMQIVHFDEIWHGKKYISQPAGFKFLKV